MNQLIMKLSIKKYQLVLIASFFFCHAAIAQFTVNLLVNNRPPSYLSDWNNAIAGQLLVTYNGTASVQVKLSSQLQDGTGTLIAHSNTATAQLININPGANIIRLDRVLQLENMIFTGGGNSLATSGKLSAGNYQLCVQLTEAGGNPLTTQQCRPFTQVNYQLPFLLSPNDKSWLDANSAQTAIIFRWSSLTPVSQEAPTYRLQVYEVMDAQTPMQALRSNQPILLTDLKRITQYIWRPQLPLKDSAAHVFIWTVQTLDSKGIPVTSPDENNQGRSEPRVFGVCNKKNKESGAPDCSAEYSW
jgi:hypothetical protein